MMKSKAFAARALAASIALLGAGTASAEILASGSYPGSHASPGSYSFSFSSAATPANLTFDLLGFKSLDGLNSYTDIFALAVNGVNVFLGTFNMGGGGYSLATGPDGTTWSTTTNGCSGPCTDTTWLGGTTHVSMPISLLSGTNTIKFAYYSPRGPFAGPQGVGDEGWGIGSYVVTAVPEPETYAMMLAGLGIVAVMARRRRQD